MDPNLRVLFDQALADEPDPPRGDLAAHVVAIGRGRRRRRLALGGSAAVALVAALGLVNLASGPAPVETVPARFASQLNPACESPARERPTDVSVFLTTDVTDDQRQRVDVLLRSVETVREVRYESRDQAYLNFQAMFNDNPDLVSAVRVQQMPESFRVKVTVSAGYQELVLRIRNTPGVDQVIDSYCPDGVSVGQAG
ncbi:permease-like cell division protein FtsX [Asanoa sp. NPDC049518]|uniref:permease-like cell division protein FtsX n=1 Tax=unclassified Asanoa TaxID=2685164 RepID=UPI00342C0633